MEMSVVQAERVRHYRSRGDSLAALQGRHFQVTVDRVLPARGKMLAHGHPCASQEAGCQVREWAT